MPDDTTEVYTSPYEDEGHLRLVETDDFLALIDLETGEVKILGEQHE